MVQVEGLGLGFGVHGLGVPGLRWGFGGFGGFWAFKAGV